MGVSKSKHDRLTYDHREDAQHLYVPLTIDEDEWPSVAEVKSPVRDSVNKSNEIRYAADRRFAKAVIDKVISGDFEAIPLSMNKARVSYTAKYMRLPM